MNSEKGSQTASGERRRRDDRDDDRLYRLDEVACEQPNREQPREFIVLRPRIGVRRCHTRIRFQFVINFLLSRFVVGSRIDSIAIRLPLATDFTLSRLAVSDCLSVEISRCGGDARADSACTLPHPPS